MKRRELSGDQNASINFRAHLKRNAGFPVFDFAILNIRLSF
jgi:hypothetical protein